MHDHACILVKLPMNEAFIFSGIGFFRFSLIIAMWFCCGFVLGGTVTIFIQSERLTKLTLNWSALAWLLG